MTPPPSTSELAKCLAGEEFDSSDPELIALIVQARKLIKDIPANCVAVGNPCKVIREL